MSPIFNPVFFKRTLPQLRERFPYAAGSIPDANGHSLSIEEIVSLAETGFHQSGIERDGRDIEWVFDRSVTNSILFQTFFDGDKPRQNSGELSSARLLRVTHDAVHDADLQERYEQDYIAFGIYNHDLPNKDNQLVKEHYSQFKQAAPHSFPLVPGGAIAFLANKLWQGDPRQCLPIQQRLTEFTDVFRLSGIARLNEQAERNGDPTRTSFLVRRGNVHKEIEQVSHDVYYIESTTSGELFQAAGRAVGEYKMLLAIKKLEELPPEFEAKYIQSMLNLATEAKNQMPQTQMRPILERLERYGLSRSAVSRGRPRYNQTGDRSLSLA